uniref:Protein kinase domain-containing protein n=1 Tax=Cynoglossus semilaevis TaxID=244447 RepID=A0A3P8VUY0_CYNSE
KNVSKVHESSGYTVMGPLGQGTFGKVLQCLKQDTKETVAVKTLPKKFAWIGKREAEILKHLQQCGHDTDTIVKFNGYSTQNKEVLLEFELLDETISGFMSTVSRPLHLSEIQIISRQVLEALDILKNIGLAHVDIKPNNIMFLDRKLHPMKVKLIDFGLAIPVTEMIIGSKIQNPNYRAPEVMLGLHLCEAVDMWSLGCTMAYMYLRTDIYSRVACEHQIMRETVHMLGNPEDHLDTCVCILDQIVLTRPHTVEFEDTQAFLSLLKQMLQIDPEKRITPNEALTHPFITMKQFPSDFALDQNEPSTSSAVQNCQQDNRNSKGELPSGDKNTSVAHDSDKSDGDTSVLETHYPSSTTRCAQQLSELGRHVQVSSNYSPPLSPPKILSCSIPRYCCPVSVPMLCCSHRSPYPALLRPSPSHPPSLLYPRLPRFFVYDPGPVCL